METKAIKLKCVASRRIAFETFRLDLLKQRITDFEEAEQVLNFWVEPVNGQFRAYMESKRGKQPQIFSGANVPGAMAGILYNLLTDAKKKIVTAKVAEYIVETQKPFKTKGEAWRHIFNYFRKLADFNTIEAAFEVAMFVATHPGTTFTTTANVVNVINDCFGNKIQFDYEECEKTLSRARYFAFTGKTILQ